MTSYQQFVRDLRYTLNHFYEPNLLRLSPLAGWLSRPRQPVTTPSALQQLLTEAIEALRPPAATPLRSQAWRTYNLLLYRYLQQFSQEEVASQLGVSLRQLGREQSTALDALASYLWDQNALSETWPSPGASATPQDSPEVEPAGPQADLSWLHNQPVERPTDLDRKSVV